MTDKKKDKEQAKEKTPAIKKKKVKAAPAPYTTKLWKGVIPIHTCAKCEFYTQVKDEIIIHVAEHLPQAKQSAALDNLMEA